MANYEKAERAKMLLIELLEQVSNNGNQKEIAQLETIIGKLESWQIKFDK